jgi:hypothetical protein
MEFAIISNSKLIQKFSEISDQIDMDWMPGVKIHLQRQSGRAVGKVA